MLRSQGVAASAAPTAPAVPPQRPKAPARPAASPAALRPVSQPRPPRKRSCAGRANAQVARRARRREAATSGRVRDGFSAHVQRRLAGVVPAVAVHSPIERPTRFRWLFPRRHLLRRPLPALAHGRLAASAWPTPLASSSGKARGRGLAVKEQRSATTRGHRCGARTKQGPRLKRPRRAAAGRQHARAPGSPACRCREEPKKKTRFSQRPPQSASAT